MSLSVFHDGLFEGRPAWRAWQLKTWLKEGGEDDDSDGEEEPVHGDHTSGALGYGIYPGTNQVSVNPGVGSSPQQGQGQQGHKGPLATGGLAGVDGAQGGHGPAGHDAKVQALEQVLQLKANNPWLQFGGKPAWRDWQLKTWLQGGEVQQVKEGEEEEDDDDFDGNGEHDLRIKGYYSERGMGPRRYSDGYLLDNADADGKFADLPEAYSTPELFSFRENYPPAGTRNKALIKRQQAVAQLQAVLNGGAPAYKHEGVYGSVPAWRAWQLWSDEQEAEEDKEEEEEEEEDVDDTAGEHTDGSEGLPSSSVNTSVEDEGVGSDDLSCNLSLSSDSPTAGSVKAASVTAASRDNLPSPTPKDQASKAAGRSKPDFKRMEDYVHEGVYGSVPAWRAWQLWSELEEDEWDEDEEEVAEAEQKETEQQVCVGQPLSCKVLLEHSLSLAYSKGDAKGDTRRAVAYRRVRSEPNTSDAHALNGVAINLSTLSTYQSL